MPVPARRIRRLHVRAPVEDDARRASTLLADAFHTASLPAADQGRLIVIRRLALGRISTRASSASLALHIERLAHEVMSDAVSWELPAALDANAVAFADAGDAIVALARLHARGADADEWFWPAIVPGWRMQASRGARWVRLLDAAHRLPQGAVVAGAVAHEAIAGGAEEILLASVSSADCVAWLRRHGWSDLRSPSARPRRLPQVLMRSPSAARWPSAAGNVDERLIWLATVLAVHEYPGAAADLQLAASVARAIADRTARASEAGTAARPAPHAGDSRDAESHAASRREPELARERDSGRAERTRGSDSQPPSSPRLGAGPAAQDRDEAVEAIDVPRAAAREFTTCGGLLFVVPILQRLGLAQYLDRHPALAETAFASRLLWAIGEQAGLTRDDPHARALLLPEAEPAARTCHIVPEFAREWSPLAYPQPVVDILATPAPRALLDSPFTPWITAVRRWSRRHARLGLMTLIRRPAHLQISRTHVDVCFTLERADVRVRRAALDVDPGWVPWLGRVVRFHYVDLD